MPARDPLLWITPSDPGGPQRSAEAVTAALGDTADVSLHGLEVWGRGLDVPYSLRVEVESVRRATETLGLSSYHLFGFSAGATVALATAARLGGAIRSVTVFEPASIGDDDWSPVETAWRSDLQVVRMQPVEARPDALAQLMLPPGESVTLRAFAARPWDARMDNLEDMLANVGFVSSGLAALTAPLLVLTGGRSHPRFARLADRLVEVVPHAAQIGFPERSHSSPPMREEPSEVARLLRSLWARADEC